jgi:hypothetical protein
MLRCNACGAIYSPTQLDGSHYFHSCPPRSRVELAQLIQAGTLGYPPSTSAATFAGADAPAGSPIAGPWLAAADAWLALGPVPRVNARNENIAHVDAAGVVTIVSEGAGVTELGPAVAAPSPV